MSRGEEVEYGIRWGPRSEAQTSAEEGAASEQLSSARRLPTCGSWGALEEGEPRRVTARSTGGTQ